MFDISLSSKATISSIHMLLGLYPRITTLDIMQFDEEGEIEAHAKVPRGKIDEYSKTHLECGRFVIMHYFQGNKLRLLIRKEN